MQINNLKCTEWRGNGRQEQPLRFVSFVFAGISLAVVLIATLVVREHLTGRLQLFDVATAPRPTLTATP